MKNGCFQTVVLEKILECPLDSKRSKQSILKEINPEYSLEGLMLETAIFWSPDSKSQFIGKDSDAGKDWRQKDKTVTEDEMVVWHHWFNGHELGQTGRDGEGQGSLACCSPWSHKESDMTDDWTTATCTQIVPVELLSHVWLLWLQGL